MTMDVAYELGSNGWDGWLEAWIVASVPVVVLPLAVMIVLAVLAATTERSTLRRRFWCALYHREAEVHFAARALLPVPCSVLSCSCFEPGSAIACQRRCLDSSYRGQWASPLAARREAGPRNAD